MSKIYVASSWRNKYQPDVVTALRGESHQVYDFRHPTVGWDNPEGLDGGFHWSDIDPDWQIWTPAEYRESLYSPHADRGFTSDSAAMEWADMCVLVTPSGPSSHMEAGWMAGVGKPVIIYMPEKVEPDLMYRLFDELCLDMDELIDAVYSRSAVDHDA